MILIITACRPLKMTFLSQTSQAKCILMPPPSMDSLCSVSHFSSCLLGVFQSQITEWENLSGLWMWPRLEKGKALGSETPSKHMNIHKLQRHIHHEFLNKTQCSCTCYTHPATGAYLGTFIVSSETNKNVAWSAGWTLHLHIWGPASWTGTCFVFYLRSAIRELGDAVSVWIHNTVNTQLAAPNLWPW